MKGQAVGCVHLSADIGTAHRLASVEAHGDRQASSGPKTREPPMTVSIPEDPTGCIAPWLKAGEMTDTDGLLRSWALTGEVEYYEAWLFGPSRPDVGPD